MNKKILALCLSAGLVVTAISGCTASAVETTSIETTIVGQVTAISDSSITLALGTEKIPDSNGAPPSKDGTSPEGTPPSQTSSDSTSTADSSTPPTAPPSNDSTAPGGLTLKGETKTITISDSTYFTIDNMGKNSSGTISDIKVGCILTVKMSGNAVSSVSVRQAGGAAAPKGTTASPTSSTVTVNGSNVNFQAYNLNNNNYFKLRDLATVLSGSGKQFEIGYDSTNNAITLTSGQSYTSVGGELETSSSTSSVSASVSTAVVYLDGSKISLAAYNIGGNNYFKLRDVAKAINFGVTYDSTTSTIGIDTTTGYTA
jgi:hypothetical protein